MTKEEHIKFIEHKIQQCIDTQSMEMEKWAFIQCLKNARKLLDQKELLIAFGEKVASDILRSDKIMTTEQSYEEFKNSL